MNFKMAHHIAMNNTEYLNHVCNVARCVNANIQSPCLLFSIGNESFYYGFDGVKLQMGKHSEKRSDYLIRTNQTLKIK